MTYAILQISAAAYADIRGRLVALDEKLKPEPTYASEYIRHAVFDTPEHLVFGPVAFEALPMEPRVITKLRMGHVAMTPDGPALGGTAEFAAPQRQVEDLTESQREEIARILETVAKDGLPGPRDLDVALDAIGCALRPA